MCQSPRIRCISLACPAGGVKLAAADCNRDGKKRVQACSAFLVVDWPVRPSHCFTAKLEKIEFGRLQEILGGVLSKWGFSFFDSRNVLLSGENRRTSAKMSKETLFFQFGASWRQNNERDGGVNSTTKSAERARTPFFPSRLQPAAANSIPPAGQAREIHRILGE